jgi:hypothetical protein
LYAKATRQKAEPNPEPEIPADIPESKINGVEAQPVAAVSAEAPPEPTLAEPAPDVAKAEAAAAEADMAAYALKRQIDAMRQAEQLQRERLEYQRVQLASQPTTREGKLEAWQAQGLTEQETQFLRDHPRMLDHHEVTTWAAQQALAAGHERNSSDYWRAIEETFDKAMSHMKARAEVLEPTPKFFAPPPAPAPRRNSAASIVSAPVSRQPPSSEPRPISPDRMATTLSVEELAVARASNISAVEYARNKLRLEREKREGTRQ